MLFSDFNAANNVTNYGGFQYGNMMGGLEHINGAGEADYGEPFQPEQILPAPSPTPTYMTIGAPASAFAPPQLRMQTPAGYSNGFNGNMHGNGYGHSGSGFGHDNQFSGRPAFPLPRMPTPRYQEVARPRMVVPSHRGVQARPVWRGHEGGPGGSRGTASSQMQTANSTNMQRNGFRDNGHMNEGNDVVPITTSPSTVSTSCENAAGAPNPLPTSFLMDGKAHTRVHMLEELLRLGKT